jgi:hypothetical protein
MWEPVRPSRMSQKGTARVPLANQSGVGYPMNAEEMARKHGKDGLALRNLLRANPNLTPGHIYRTRYEIYENDEKRIKSHPGFAGMDRRKTR